jgi:hypothetical protein
MASTRLYVGAVTLISRVGAARGYGSTPQCEGCGGRAR